jgi:hypothetical protein
MSYISDRLLLFCKDLFNFRKEKDLASPSFGCRKRGFPFISSTNLFKIVTVDKKTHLNISLKIFLIFKFLNLKKKFTFLFLGLNNSELQFCGL